MSEAFVGEIRMFAATFAPRSWANCDGQLVAISQNDALFSLLGTIYGGDGRTTFGLPDLRGRVPVHSGAGPGLSPRPLGQKGGQASVTLTAAELPVHTHALKGTDSTGTVSTPLGKVVAEANSDIYADSLSPANFATQAVTSRGGSQSHTNLQPFLGIRFIIALYGVYPSRH